MAREVILRAIVEINVMVIGVIEAVTEVAIVAVIVDAIVREIDLVTVVAIVAAIVAVIVAVIVEIVAETAVEIVTVNEEEIENRKSVPGKTKINFSYLKKHGTMLIDMSKFQT